MKLIEYKDNHLHYFKDDQGRFQGEYKSWYLNGQRHVMTRVRDGEIHGESKLWYENGQRSEVSHFQDGLVHGEYKSWKPTGELEVHTFDIDGREIIDFLKNPELYPTTPEEKTYFALKYGTAPFIGDDK